MFKKLFVITFIITSLLFITLFIYINNNSQQALQAQKHEDMNIILERTGQYLDLYLNNIKNIILSIATNEQVLKMPPEDIEKLLRTYGEANPDIIGNVFFVYPDESVISNRQIYFEIIKHDKLDYLYQLALKNSNSISWSEPYHSPLIAGKTIAFLYPLKNNEGRITSVLALEINLDHLNRQMSTLISGQKQTFAIISSESNVISLDTGSNLIPYKARTLPYEMKEKFNKKLQDLKNGISELTSKSTEKDKSLMVLKNNNNSLNWNLYMLLDIDVFHKNANELFKNFFQIWLIYIFLILVTTFIISYHFTKPIHNLAIEMDNIKDNSLSINKPSQRQDEIGMLSRSFYELMNRITNLMQQQKETERHKRKAELKMLQSQIQPHFLGNTLKCIGSLARQQKNSDVQMMIRSLILLLNYSINKTKEIIKLEEELELLEAYLYIQQIRYGQSFHFEIKVAEKHLSCQVPKLILQPIVENSIFHGFANMEKGGFILIESIKIENDLHLIIKDNGQGMNKEKSQAVLNNIAPDSDNKFNSIGLDNVVQRIKLRYGEEYGLFIQSNPGKGTTVELHLPYKV